MSNRFDNLTGHREAPGHGSADEAGISALHEPLMTTLMAVNDPVTISSLILALTCGFLVVSPSNRRQAKGYTAEQTWPDGQLHGNEISERGAKAGLPAFERRLWQLAQEREAPSALAGRTGLFRSTS